MPIAVGRPSKAIRPIDIALVVGALSVSVVLVGLLTTGQPDIAKICAASRYRIG